MKILGIDTSSKRCTTCILEDNNVIAELHSDDEKTHSQTLMPLIDKMFTKTNLTLNDIDLLACSIGPGSFTGVRIGISTAKAFADVYNFKTVGVSSLEGLAYNIKNDISLLNINVICSLIDAKNENVYYGLFDKNYNMLEELSTCSINELIDKLKKFNTSIAFVGVGAIAYRNKLEQALGQDLSNSTEIDLNNNLEVSSTLSTYFFEEEKNLASSISIARFAYNKYVNSNDATKDYNSSLSPMYLRKSQAERSLEEKQERQGE